MTMRAVRVTDYGGPEVLKLETIPIPTPKDGEVLIKVYSAGVNPCDVLVRSGGLGRNHDRPFISGCDAAGVVEDVGSGVTEFKKGDRVYTVANFAGGSYAEYITSAERLVSPLSPRLSFAQGASIGVPYWTAYKALYNKANCRPGETVLIHGASGAVGVAAVQMARANRQRVIGTAGSQKGLDLVTEMGADLVFSHKEAGYMDNILKSTGGKGVDVILEMLANVNLDRDLDLLAFRGRVVVIGSRGTIEINPRKTMLKESTIVGLMLMSVESEKEWKEIEAGVSVGAKVGWLNPVVGKKYSLAEAAQAQIDVMSDEPTFGKLVIDTAMTDFDDTTK